MQINRKKILFIDRDGTLIEEPKTDFQIDSFEKLKFEPGVIGALRSILDNTDYRLVMVSNQDGLGTSSLPQENFDGPHNLMTTIFEGEGVLFDEVLIDPSFPEEKSPNRKPEIGLVRHYLNELLDKENSYVIGDRVTDLQLAKNMGINAIYYATEGDEVGELPVSLTSHSWSTIADFIQRGSRRLTSVRKTNETDIEIFLDLNGTGRATIHTGLGFFDHMLDQIARHGEVDLEVSVKGDLHIDEHHTIEDTALQLGEVFREAIGSKKGLARYGFALPMDDCEAKVLLDFGGRAHLVWNVPLQNEYVGDFPTDMTKHFFESFCQTAQCNLNIEAKGENTHHLIEAVFKAFARAIKQAKVQSGNLLPSSKGVL